MYTPYDPLRLYAAIWALRCSICKSRLRLNAKSMHCLREKERVLEGGFWFCAEAINATHNAAPANNGARIDAYHNGPSLRVKSLFRAEPQFAGNEIYQSAMAFENIRAKEPFDFRAAPSRLGNSPTLQIGKANVDLSPL